ncbi:MAG: nickel-dependent hydrogenase large subunit [Candidatus Aenigmarchaeota archaeon]|nr:nickel-dependent hydrogenase large subunit [Candidatus Aenigmarchaeota archaeon]
MHNELDITLENISKTEGHADLDVKVVGGKVTDVKLKISENKRFFTQAIRDKPLIGLPQLVSRICGTCSIAHLTCCTEAAERALEIVPSDQTMLFRKLSMYGLMIRDHAMHLYLFVLPDLFGKDSVLEFDESQHELVHQAFDVKGVGNNLSKIIAGRSVHATIPQIGSFSKIPKKDETDKIVKELKGVRSHVIELVDIFQKCNFEFKRSSNFVVLTTKDFSFLEGEIRSSTGTKVKESDYWDFLTRVVIPYSQATGFKFEGKEYMVGALSRLNLNKDALHKDTKRDLSDALKMFPSDNVYHNNLAQAIEILHSIDHSIELLEANEFKEESKPEVKIKEGQGIGVIEAPRGTLYYMLSVNSEGKIKFGNLVIPTAQNQIKMENDIRELIPQILDKNREEIELELEKLIRAYDPCMSCASHFLKVNWR